MEHTDALETNASDRYLLGQLSAAEADAFEEHYFECPLCAEDIRLGMSFMDAGRRLVREATEPAATPMAPVIPIESHPRRSKWLPAAAAAAVLAMAGNVGLLVRLKDMVPRAAQVAGALGPANALVSTASITVDPARSESPDVTVLNDRTGVFNVFSDRSYPDFEVQLLNAAGAVVAQRRYNEKQLAENPPGVDPRLLPPGDYQLVIFGIEPRGQFRQVARHRVIVERRK